MNLKDKCVLIRLKRVWDGSGLSVRWSSRALSGNTAALLRTLQRARQLTDAAKAGLNDVQAVTPLWGFADLLLPHSNSQPTISTEGSGVWGKIQHLAIEHKLQRSYTKQQNWFYMLKTEQFAPIIDIILTI